MVATRATRRFSVALLLGSASVLLACVSCGERRHSNPLDPSNEDTGGSPPGFIAVALDSRVALRWEPLRLNGLLGLNAYRRGGDSAEFQLLPGSPFDAEAGAAVDSVVSNGVTYEYKLVPSIEDFGEGVSSAVRPATPGPDFAVLCDACEGLVTKLAADMRASVWTAGGLFYPRSLFGRGNKIWFVDAYAGVYCATLEGAFIWRNGDPVAPVSLAVSENDVCAVVDAGAATVSLISAGGATSLTIPAAFQTPTDVAFDTEGNVWVADRGAGTVSKFSQQGVQMAAFTGCREPRFLDTDSVDGACWVADAATGDVVKLDPEASEVLRVPMSETISAVEADRKQGGCWVADSQNGRVTRIARDGRVLFRVGKLGGPVSVFPSRSGKTWVADADGARVIVLAENGELLSVVKLGQCPNSIIVVHGSGAD
jgi:sugar lactone lactonase YvrE